MLAWPATPDRFAFNKSSTLPQQRIRRLAEAEKENWHKRSVHANLQNVARNLERAKRRLRISRPGVRVPSIAPNQENPNLFPIGEGFGFSFSWRQRQGRLQCIPVWGPAGRPRRTIAPQPGCTDVRAAGLFSAATAWGGRLFCLAIRRPNR